MFSARSVPAKTKLLPLRELAACRMSVPLPFLEKSAVPAPFESTGWQTIWLDHFSFGATNYKASASFYTSLLGWQPTVGRTEGLKKMAACTSLHLTEIRRALVASSGGRV